MISNKIFQIKLLVNPIGHVKNKKSSNNNGEEKSDI